VGEHLMRVYGGGLTTYAAHSFDFALYGQPLNSKDGVIGISHRGNKLYTQDSLKRARKAGCYTALITGEGIDTSTINSDISFHTVAQEKSSAHTVSYVGAITVLASLAESLGYHRTGKRLLPDSFLSEEIPKALRASMETESEMAHLARKHLNRRRLWLVVVVQVLSLLRK
jgi:glucosamine--fructose-6-phosphate aminotransferase (isomerizing)